MLYSCTDMATVGVKMTDMIVRKGLCQPAEIGNQASEGPFPSVRIVKY